MKCAFCDAGRSVNKAAGGRQEETVVNACTVGKSKALRQKKGGGDWYIKEDMLRRQLDCDERGTKI